MSDEESRVDNQDTKPPARESQSELAAPAGSASGVEAEVCADIAARQRKGVAPGYAHSREIEIRDLDKGGTRIITRDERRRCKNCDGKGTIAILCGCDRNGMIFSHIECRTCDGAGYVAHNEKAEL